MSHVFLFLFGDSEPPVLNAPVAQLLQFHLPLHYLSRDRCIPITEESEGMRPEVTAFLLYSKGQEVLDPETFDKMQQEQKRGTARKGRPDGHGQRPFDRYLQCNDKCTKTCP